MGMEVLMKQQDEGLKDLSDLINLLEYSCEQMINSGKNQLTYH